MNIVLFYSYDNILAALAYGVLLVYLGFYLRIYTRQDLYYICTSIFLLSTDISLERTLNAVYFYFYFIILLVLLLIALSILNLCYSLTDNVVITMSSTICSFVFMIIFYLLTNEEIHILSLLVKILLFFIIEMMIVAIIVMSQNL
ncbi:hypothetical protein NEMIN01_1511 [Nematocida minor]|uniref:uncharacterized protein n=1 Tax=Nematocida minor TaxID=1912983 RepID=UPI00221F6432|nr:uncharacterized protein NEMIN01_1511 [Nematocida minor]KAI5191435.1 hypothetical protein NEMIN01_1511 [Nematocida minor]